LDALAVRVDRALLVDGRGRGAGADHAQRGAAEDDAAAAGGEDHGVAREVADGHRLQVLGDAADAGAVVVEDGLDEVPELELADHLLAGERDAVLVHDVGRLPAADLLVEGVEELLAGGGAGEGGAVEEAAAEAAEVEEALGRAVERDA